MNDQMRPRGGFFKIQYLTCEIFIDMNEKNRLDLGEGDILSFISKSHKMQSFFLLWTSACSSKISEKMVYCKHHRWKASNSSVW